MLIDQRSIVIDLLYSLQPQPVYLFFGCSTIGSCLIYARALLEYVIFILCVRSFSKMLPYVKFAEEKVLVFVILREKCKNSATLSLTLILTVISRAY